MMCMQRRSRSWRTIKKLSSLRPWILRTIKGWSCSKQVQQVPTGNIWRIPGVVGIPWYGEWCWGLQLPRPDHDYEVHRVVDACREECARVEFEQQVCHSKWVVASVSQCFCLCRYIVASALEYVWTGNCILENLSWQVCQSVCVFS